MCRPTPTRRETRDLKVFTVNGPETIYAFLSCSPDFVVHETIFDRPNNEAPLYTVTHVATGLAFTTCAPSLRAAELLAGVLGALPVDWGKLSGRPSEKTKVRHDLGEALWAWISQWNRGAKGGTQ